jgi:DNA-binding NtrC family response regulator
MTHDQAVGENMAQDSKHPILVVDDEPEILFSLRALLRHDFDVHTAESGAEALAVIARQPIHVVMTDQRMPELTGVELLTRVMGEWPDAIRMVFTGYADIKAVIDAINQGHIFRYVTKPWDPDELLSVLRQAGEEYDRIAAQQRLLVEVREYQAQTLSVVEGLRTGQLGSLNADGLAKVDQLAATGGALLGRLDRLPAPDTRREA